MASGRKVIKVTQKVQRVQQKTCSHVKIDITHFHSCKDHPLNFDLDDDHYKRQDLVLYHLSLDYPDKKDGVEDILGQSLDQQKEFQMEDATGFVTVILKRCLDALKIKSKVVYGRRELKDSDYPHIWLKVKDRWPIDNPQQLNNDNLGHIMDHYPKCYHECEFGKKGLPPSDRQKVDDRDIYLKERRVEFYAHHPDFALALCLNREKWYNYYFAMIRFMYEKYKVSIVGVDPSVRYMCWKCKKFPKAARRHLSNIIPPERECVEGEKDPDLEGSTAKEVYTWKFKQCQQCMVASYCSRECQKEDWANHKIHCVSRSAVDLPLG